jgi:hypothetical protein
MSMETPQWIIPLPISIISSLQGPSAEKTTTEREHQIRRKKEKHPQ